MPIYTDQLKRDIEIVDLPQRIISLVPSQTELLYDLGLENEVIGLTKFCVHPSKWFKSKIRIGGTKQLHLDQIRQLQPDLIIANKEENVKEQIDSLANEFPVWVSDVNNLSQALFMITSIGIITGRQERSGQILKKIEDGFKVLSSGIQYKQEAVYLIWKDPFMTVGGDTFINDMMEHAGLINLFKNNNRYPAITQDEIKNEVTKANAGKCLVLLSSEPYPFSEKHIEELKECLPGVTFLMVDGEMFSWYGSRLLKAPAYFLELQKQIRA